MRYSYLAAALAVTVVNAVSALTPTDLMCELLAKTGLVPVTDAAPEFSWGFKDARPGDYQRAYQIQAATSTAFLRAGKPDLWDSGKVGSSQSLFVTYAGAPLPASSTVFWRVRVWDRRGKQGAWSQTMAFATADELGADTPLRYPLTQKQVKPVRVVTNSLGRVFVDFGRAAFGWVELLTPPEMQRGGAFTLHLGEKANGLSVDAKPGGTIRYAKVRGALTRPGVYRVPLEADKRNTSGGKEGSAILLPPEFGVVMPFRYVEIEECPYPVTAETIRQIAVHYPFDMQAAAFVSSEKVLDQIYSFCKYSIKATTFAGVYVDGDRERIPYEADAYINQLCHYCLDREFTIARYSHEYLMAHPTWPTEWKQHSVMMAWADWMYTGNTESLARQYDRLKAEKTLEFAARASDGLLVTGGPSAPMNSGLRDITDWPHGERDGFEFKPVNAVVNAFYCLNLGQMAEMAEALGKAADASEYRSKADRATKAFNALFYNSERGCYVDGEGAVHASLHANMLPLAFGLVPESEGARVARFVKNRGMACSVYGAQYLLEALYEAGLEEYALQLMTRDDPRGWVNMMRSGSTITLEAWDIKFKPNLDWNHAWGAVPANILPRYVMGVRPLEAGFGKILIRPQVASLEAIQGIMPTVRGPVTVGVRQMPGEHYKVMFEIPVNTTARLELPAFTAACGKFTLNGKGMPYAVDGHGRLVLDNVPSGSHVAYWECKEARCGSKGANCGGRTSGAGWRAWVPFF
ncbi:MAG: family 78 glycoside hydrolase catalytic domain [Kiritimatiellae bacterium]|nr:family 78 glycoside hydrolase catalytic domain [Kiritimatiellia bacterium]